MTAISKAQWVLLALNCVPLDRIRLMKTLFLFWYKADQNIPGFFEFEPYLYGPCSFELYGVLDDLETRGLILRAPHPVPQRATYHLSAKGREECQVALTLVQPDMVTALCLEAEFAAGAEFTELLGTVYKLAPEFAERSVVRV